MTWWGRRSRRREQERDLEKELRFHIEQRVADFIRLGLGEEEARRKVRQEFGGMDQVKEDCRDARGTRWLDSIWKDLRFGARQLRLNPGFTAVAVASLALGIGANTAIFELVNAVRLRALPVADADQLAYIDFPSGSMRSGVITTRSGRFTYAQWEQLQSSAEPFSGLIAWSATRFNLASGGEARYAEGLYVNGTFFRVLGISPLIGRTFTAADDEPGCESPGVVISHAFWQSELGGDPNVTARTLTLDRRTLPIIGVTPTGFFGVEVGHQYEVAVPICADKFFAGDEQGRAASRRSWWISVMGRLKPDWPVSRADGYIKAQAPLIMEATLPPSYRPDQVKRYLANKLEITRGSTGVSDLRREYQDPLMLLLSITGVVLLIACANLANLLLARASVREREIAVRQAIGASRTRVITQLLVESLLLSFVGTILGALLARVLSRSLVAFLATENDRLFVGLSIDWRVLGFTSLVGMLACVLFGLLPALRATRVSPASAMRAGGRGLTAGRERFTAQRALMVAQVALSLVLLTGALVFTGSLRNLLRVDTGFRADGLVMMDVTWQDGQLARERSFARADNLLEQVRELPGVASAAEVGWTPMSGAEWSEMVWPDGVNAEHQPSYFNRVGAGYFMTMGTPLLAGREFDARDTAAATKVAIVNDAFVKRFLGERSNPIGRLFRFEGRAGQADPVFQVVGVVRNTKYLTLREQFPPIAFLPVRQDENPRGGPTLVVRSALPQDEVIRAVKSLMSSHNPDARLGFQVISRQIERSLMRDRLMANLAGAFGLLAALLATLGLYGVIAYIVARRRNEIGVRIALGADRRRVVWLVLRESALLLSIGLGLGVALTIYAARTVETLVYGLKPADPVVLSSAMGLLAVVAMAASYVPARSASRLDPMQALRQE